MEWIVLLLIVYLIFRDSGIKIPSFKKNESKEDIVEDIEVKRKKEEFDKLMNYNITTAINSKRGE
jgi:hypothetical protein